MSEQSALTHSLHLGMQRSGIPGSKMILLREEGRARGKSFECRVAAAMEAPPSQCHDHQNEAVIPLTRKRDGSDPTSEQETGRGEHGQGLLAKRGLQGGDTAYIGVARVPNATVPGRRKGWYGRRAWVRRAERDENRGAWLKSQRNLAEMGASNRRVLAPRSAARARAGCRD